MVFELVKMESGIMLHSGGEIMMQTLSFQTLFLYCCGSGDAELEALLHDVFVP